MTTPQTNTKTVWICEQCQGQASANPCPHHPDEPLLDAHAEGMAVYLSELDDRARRTLFKRWIVSLTVVFGALSLLFAVDLNHGIHIDLAPPLFAALVGLFLGRAIAAKQFKPSYEAWSV